MVSQESEGVVVNRVDGQEVPFDAGSRDTSGHSDEQPLKALASNTLA